MENRNPLSQLLLLIRKRRGLSADEAAERLDMLTVDYLLIEERPDHVQIAVLVRILRALDATLSERQEFLVIASQYLGEKDAPPIIRRLECKPSPFGLTSPKSEKSVLSLEATRNLPSSSADQTREEGEC